MSRPTQGPTRAPTRTGLSPSLAQLSRMLPVRPWSATGLVRVRSPLLTESRLMSFPPVTEMFQFTGFASRGYGFTARYRRSGGFSHSEIPGSKPARGSPGLIATCYVLHRLSVPRHPPNALLALEPRNFHAQAPACQQTPRSQPVEPCRGRSVPGTPLTVRHQTSSRFQTTATPQCGGRQFTHSSRAKHAMSGARWWRRTESNR